MNLSGRGLRTQLHADWQAIQRPCPLWTLHIRRSDAQKDDSGQENDPTEDSGCKAGWGLHLKIIKAYVLVFVTCLRYNDIKYQNTDSVFYILKPM